MLPVPKSRIPSSWVKVKLTGQLEPSQSEATTLPVTSTLQISPTQFKARWCILSNTGCTCQLRVPAEMGKERPVRPPLGPRHWPWSGQQGKAMGVEAGWAAALPSLLAPPLLHLMPVANNCCHGHGLFSHMSATYRHFLPTRCS